MVGRTLALILIVLFSFLLSFFFHLSFWLFSLTPIWERERGGLRQCWWEVGNGGGAAGSSSGSFGPVVDGTLPFVALPHYNSPPQTHRNWSQRPRSPQMGQIHDGCKSSFFFVFSLPIFLIYGLMGPNLNCPEHGAFSNCL